MKEIKFVGKDSFDREVFVTERGSFVVDVNLDYSRRNMSLYSKINNDFDGEPFLPLNTDNFKVVEEFLSERLFYGDDDGRPD